MDVVFLLPGFIVMEKDIQIPINIYNDEENDDRSSSSDKGTWQCFQFFVERVSLMLVYLGLGYYVAS